MSEVYGLHSPTNYNCHNVQHVSPLANDLSLKSYSSSSSSYRAFCSTCGSSIAFGNIDKPEQTEIHVGTLDEEVLIGRHTAASKREGKHEGDIMRIGGLGKEICQAECHIYCENAIPGITDKLDGVQYLTDRNAKRVPEPSKALG